MTNISDLPSSPFGMPMHPGASGRVHPLSRERVAASLTRLGINFVLDEDGDPISLWERFLLRFISTGNNLEVLQVRGLWAAQPPAEVRGELLEWLNEWHSEHRWPMGFLHRVDEDTTVVFADVNTDLEFGATDDQLDQLIRCAAGTSSAFYEALTEAFPASEGWIPVAPEPQTDQH